MTASLLNIAASESSPEIVGDWEAGVLSMRGDAYPENRQVMFGPVMTWLHQYLAESRRPLRLELQLVFLNTSSIRGMVHIFDLLQDASIKGHAVEVNWYYLRSNDYIAELAAEFREGCSFPFMIVAREE